MAKKSTKKSSKTAKQSSNQAVPSVSSASASAIRVEKLNASIEAKKKASVKKPKNNPAYSDQNLAMDLIPSTKPAKTSDSRLAKTSATNITEASSEDLLAGFADAEPVAETPDSRAVTTAETPKNRAATTAETPEDAAPLGEIPVFDSTQEDPAQANLNDSTQEDPAQAELDDADLIETLADEKPDDDFATSEPEPLDVEPENPKVTQDIALTDLETGVDLETEPVNRKSKMKKWRVLPKLISLITVGLLAYLCYSIVIANVLPTLHLSLLLGGLALFSLLSLFKSFRKKTRTPVLIIFLVINLAVSAVSAFAILKINDTLNFFSQTLGVSNKEVSVYHLIVKSSSPKNSISDLKGEIIYTQRDLTIDSSTISSAVHDQVSASVSFSDDLDYLLGLIDGSSTNSEIGASASSSTASEVNSPATVSQDPVLLINAGTYDGIITDNSTFADKTKIIGEVKVEINVEHAELDNITTKPFVIYLSGIDTRSGTLPTRSLSDVNMVAVVNPVSRKLLLVSIPRDYYVHIAGTSATALRDKLTHAGALGGVQLSMATISELLDVELDQYFRVNFNFVENLVDAIGGINVYNDQNYSFSGYTNRNCTYQPGYNYVYGACALAFARERYAYKEGDRHRGENQQQVIKLVLDKVTSSSTIISKYSEILESLVGTFETTLTQDNITDLVKMHVADMTPWTVETYNLNGTTGMDATYSYPTQNLSIMYPDETTIETAKQKISAALGLVEERTTEEN